VVANEVVANEVIANEVVANEVVANGSPTVAGIYECDGLH